jgi:hypothetical protein
LSVAVATTRLLEGNQGVTRATFITAALIALPPDRREAATVRRNRP